MPAAHHEFWHCCAAYAKRGSRYSMPSGTVSVELVEKSIDAIFTQVAQCHLPGAAVGIAIGGKPVYRKGFGLASMELPVLLTSATRMRIYSTTKHFTCLAYLLLCEEGKSSIEDPVGRYLSWAHPVARKATMRHLMTNTSGLLDACEIRWMLSGTDIPESPTAEIVGLYRDIDTVNFSPGQAYCYNNAGFHILTAAIEQASGQSLEEVFRTRIFEPVGMYDTLLRRVDTDFVPNSATMHMMSPDGRFRKSFLPGEITGEGGIVSTVDDILRWLVHMDRPIVGSAETWRMMKTSAQLPDGAATGYGMGLILGCHRGVETVSHSGGGLGSNSEMIKVPSVGLDITIMVNRHDVSATELAKKVIDACIAGLKAPAESRAGPLVTGVYQSPNTGHVVLLRAQDGKQMLSYNGGWEVVVERDTEGDLSLPDGSMCVTLLGSKNSPERLRFETRGRIDELTAVEPLARATPETIVGTYRSAPTDTEVTILQRGEEVLLQSRGRWGSTVFRLSPVARGIWQAKLVSNEQWSGLLLFNPHDRGFCFMTGRTWKLPFHRET